MGIVYSIIIILIAYLIGSFPTGYLLVKIVKKQDIREIGSGSTGATNVKRVLGKKGFFFVMIFDALKGFLPVFLAQYVETKYGIFSDANILSVLVAVALIFGHSKSIFLGFSGGKSVATTAGTIFGLNFPAALSVVILWTIISWFSKYISLASIISVAVLPVLMFFFKAPLSYVIYCVLAAIYVIYLHRENIKRLLNGTENKVRK